ncbi:hypothetical protein BO99DRAFT_463720 [Aspergillus violaceofuscus CBS 115571]|uniref:Uncharacterized protein n=1 Tax=Aspergillus violaceofuscus (strain CBS 115571) TaxID=1450538 RepID=A0A2V5HZE7_ASPV1|nr:hypothetical protein BO99DRAFT_463720 [Aspergillus violaceofuscus CBS 115571]
MNNRFLQSLHNWEAWIDSKLGVETMGIERIPEDQRRPPENLNMMFFWFSVLLSPTLIPIGMLGPIFGLSVHTSVILTVFATLLGSSVPAFTATLSPPTGLRQIAVARLMLCGLSGMVCPKSVWRVGFVVWLGDGKHQVPGAVVFMLNDPNCAIVAACLPCYGPLPGVQGRVPSPDRGSQRPLLSTLPAARAATTARFCVSKNNSNLKKGIHREPPLELIDTTELVAAS